MQSQNYWQRGWRRFRDAVWPVLEPQEPEKSESPMQEGSIVIEDENLDQALALITKFAESEEDRRKTVESKATLLLSVISITTTLIIASNTLLSRDVGKAWSAVSLVGLSFMLCLYAIKTVWFTIKVLERGNYHTLSFKDINQKGDKNRYRKHLILSMWKNARGNFGTINSKVDYMHMAQLYYKRAIIVIGLYSLFIFLFCLL